MAISNSFLLVHQRVNYQRVIHPNLPLELSRSGPPSSPLVPLQGVPCNASSAWRRPLGSRCWKAGEELSWGWREDGGKYLGKIWEHTWGNMGKTWGSSGKKLGKTWGSSGKNLGKTWGNSWKKLGKVLKIMEEHDSFMEKLGTWRNIQEKWWQSDSLNLGHWCWGSLESQIMVDISFFFGGEGMIVYWGSKIGNSLWEACQMWNNPPWIIREHGDNFAVMSAFLTLFWEDHSDNQLEYKVAPPSDVCWFMIPINYRYYPHKTQLLDLKTNLSNYGAPPCSI